MLCGHGLPAVVSNFAPPRSNNAGVVWEAPELSREATRIRARIFNRLREHGRVSHEVAVASKDGKVISQRRFSIVGAVCTPFRVAWAVVASLGSRLRRRKGRSSSWLLKRRAPRTSNMDGPDFAAVFSSDDESNPACWPEVAAAFQESLLRTCNDTLEPKALDDRALDADDESCHQGVCDRHADTRQQELLKPGSFFQNPYMSLWSQKGTPVSATLHVLDENSLTLRCENLDSVRGGSDGWVEFHGTFELRDVPGVSNRIRLIPQPTQETEAVRYDPALFDCKANFALSCLKRVGGAALGAFKFEVDTERGVVYAEPKVSVLRWFWDTSAGLEKTSRQHAWTLQTAGKIRKRRNKPARSPVLRAGLSNTPPAFA